MSLGFLDLLVWLLVIEVLSLCVVPFLAWMLPKAPDRGYGISKVFGVFTFGIMTWLIPSTGLVSASQLFVTAAFAVILVIGYAGWFRRDGGARKLWNELSSHAYCVEALFLGLTFIFVMVRFFNSEIFWGEKPMDSTFLNFFVRNTELPPQDPWAAGHTMSYYYLGIYYIAALLKLTGIPVSVGYNLAIGTLAGLIGSGLYSLFIKLTRSGIAAFCAAAFLTLSSDPEVLNLCIFQLRETNFDTFWASTRVFTSPFFFEYTSWSMLFADLHAHVIALPFTVLVLVLTVSLFADTETRFSDRGAAHRLILGACWGALFGMNTWDFISYGLVVGVFVILAKARPFWRPPVRPDGTVAWSEILFANSFARVVNLVWDGALIACGAALVAMPFILGTGGRTQVGWGWAHTGEFNTFMQLVRTFGYWIFAAIFAFVLFAESRWQLLAKQPVRQLFQVLALAVLFFALPITNMLSGAVGQPWMTFVFAWLIACFSWLFLWRNTEDSALHSVAILLGLSSLLVVILEELFLIDRMNTLFKGYIAVWMLMGVGASALLVCTGQARWRKGGMALRGVVITVPTLLIAFSLLGTILNIRGILRLQRVPTRIHTLDGSAYLAESNPEDSDLIRWINKNVVGTPVLLEAHGESYREYTRIAMHTGLPTVLGWDYHVMQRGVPGREVEARRRAVQIVYSTSDISVVKTLLLQHHVDLIVVSGIESRDYPAVGIQKFEAHPEIFVPLFRSGGATIYATYFSKLNPEFKGRLGT